LDVLDSSTAPPLRDASAPTAKAPTAPAMTTASVIPSADELRGRGCSVSDAPYHRGVAETSSLRRGPETVAPRDFFTRDLATGDAAIKAALSREEERQRTQLELIAPKNYMSRAAREALASIIAFTSVEGYPGERWHAGTVNLDEIEGLAAARARELFACGYANVQPHSGRQANQAVFFAFLEPGDTILSMSLRDGGHLSHGDRDNLSGRWFRAVHYGVRKGDGLIDYDEMEAVARRERPRLIIVGGSGDLLNHLVRSCISSFAADASSGPRREPVRETRFRPRGASRRAPRASRVQSATRRRSPTSPDAAELAAFADKLEATIATAEPRQAKTLLGLLIKELRVNARSEILPKSRVVTPAVCARPSSVGAHGIEPSMPRGIIREARRVPTVAGLRVGTAARRGAGTFV
jgi:Serine hydroxymethyltransferase